MAQLVPKSSQFCVCIIGEWEGLLFEEEWEGETEVETAEK